MSINGVGTVSAMDEPRYIDMSEGLLSLCKELESATWLALDTEFMRVNTYHSRLCLVQVASDYCCACVDVLAHA